MARKKDWGEIYHAKVIDGWDNGAAMAWADLKTKLKCSYPEHDCDGPCWCEPDIEHHEDEDFVFHRDFQ